MVDATIKCIESSLNEWWHSRTISEKHNIYERMKSAPHENYKRGYDDASFDHTGERPI
jgi:hypothetical protein